MVIAHLAYGLIANAKQLKTVPNSVLIRVLRPDTKFAKTLVGPGGGFLPELPGSSAKVQRLGFSLVQDKFVTTMT